MINWDRFLYIDGKLGEARGEIDAAIRWDKAAGKRCGNCTKWMKSRECLKEHNVDGISRGPSMDAPACDQFIETHLVATYRQLANDCRAKAKQLEEEATR